MVHTPSLPEFLAELQSVSLDELVGGMTDKTLIEIKDANHRVAAARIAVREAEERQESIEARTLRDLHQSGNAGKNDTERAINSRVVLDESTAYAVARVDVQSKRAELERAQADLDALNTWVRIITSKARFLGACINYATELGE